MTNNPYLKKQIVFPGFLDRMMAGAIDLFAVICIFSEIMKLASVYLFKYRYGDFLTANNLTLNNVDDIQVFVNMEGFLPYLTLPESILYAGSRASFQYFLISVYFFTCWYYFDRTIGKFFLNMKIVDFQTLKKPSIKQYIIRYLSYLLYPFGILWIFAGDNRRALHDRLSKTVVIKA